MAECNIDKCCFEDVKVCVKVNSVNGIKPNADGEVDIDESFVTTNTPQTIHGSKTFTNTIETNGMNTEAMLTTMNGLKIDTAPIVTNKSSIKWNDEEQNEVSSVEVSRPANTKDTCISLSANTITEWGSNEKASIEVHAKAGATSYATAPTPSSNATGNEIVTAEWVIDKGLADDSNVVHKTSNETIAGDKAFSNTIFRKADLTTSTVETVYQFTDSNANPCGCIYNRAHWHAGYVYNRHTAYNSTADKDAYLEVKTHTSGKSAVSIGGTATLDNMTRVVSDTSEKLLATMGWVNNPTTSTNVVHRSGNEIIAGNKTFSSKIVGNLQGNADTATSADNGVDRSGTNYVKFKDGTQICWGSNKGDTKVTFANAFTSTPRISFGYCMGSLDNRVVQGQAIYASSTSFTMQVWSFSINTWVHDMNVEWIAIGRWK